MCNVAVHCGNITTNTAMMSTITNPIEGALTQLGSLYCLLRILDVCEMRHRVEEDFAERLFKSSILNSHDSETSHIAKYGYSLTCPSIRRHNMYINVHLLSMERRLVARRQVCWFDAGKDV